MMSGRVPETSLKGSEPDDRRVDLPYRASIESIIHNRTAAGVSDARQTGSFGCFGCVMDRSGVTGMI